MEPENKTKQQTKKIMIAIWSLLAVAIALSIYVYVQQLPPPAHKYDAFAKCIQASGATFYGAFWCPHCAAQKREFGTGAQYLPYVECSEPNYTETQSCKDLGVSEYPTWVFKDGSTSTGDTSLAVLAQKTGCALPTST